MEALIFIKKCHKKYLYDNKIDNNIFDEEGHNYEYYEYKYCLINFLEKHKDYSENDEYFHFYENIPYKDVIKLPLYFNKYEFINMPEYDIEINYIFNNIIDVRCNNFILNSNNNCIRHVIFKHKIIFNNQNIIDWIKIETRIYNLNSLIIVNYPLLNKIQLFTHNINYKIINNTNNNIIFYYKVGYMYNNLQINNFILNYYINYQDIIKYNDNTININKKENDNKINLIIKPHSKVIITFI